MRLALAALLAVAPAVAHAERIFPSLPDEYRSGTVELHLAAYGDRGGLGLSGRDGAGGGLDNRGATNPGLGLLRGAIQAHGSDGSIGGVARGGGTVTDGRSGLRGGGV
jgi:hypothetical protein